MNKISLVDLKGGLGNQIFQIAYALHLKNLGHKTFVDLSFFDQDNLFPRNLEINPKEFDLKTLNFKNNRIFFLLNTWFEEDSSFSSNDFKFLNRFVGYYQDLKYLEESKDKFRNVLGIKSDKTLQETVLVHIRRTDYLKISQELDLKFYTNALKAFNPDIKIDIFTDEMNFQYDKFFIKKNVRNIFLNNNKTSPSETLRKMSMYKNFIIANSSYSLIAAYLSLSKEKKVVYPEPWFKNSNIYINNIPKLWIPEKNI